MASAEQEIQFNTGNTLGALQIGTLISFTLFGVTTSQVYTYYSRFPEDAWHLKALVAFTWMCDLAHAICVATLLYTDDILDYRHPERFLLAPSKLFGVIILFSALITAAVQSFFSFRIYRISKRSAFPLFTASLTFLRTLAAIGLLYAINHVDSWAQFLARWDWLGTSLFCISAANDVIITMGMVFLLFRRRRKALNRTMAHLDRIITWTIETGLMTSVFTLLELAFFLTMQSNCGVHPHTLRLSSLTSPSIRHLDRSVSYRSALILYLSARKSELALDPTKDE
ncbi:unnamed protein product [Mycena citricolor]|uniref:DUF6534 domain-containing protein n=1 Tax=Mycena citricolor TaxID=2018698 RepID=A0AAD2HA67_9AGAR|nr:unnamed protein product [Mycena citricolor]CAK5272880.1 unnamed protein product [Mycena citricolor]